MLCIWEVELYSQKLLVKERKRGESSENTTRVGKRQ